MSQRRQLGFKCGVTGKLRHVSEVEAQKKADNLYERRITSFPQHPYHCGFCGGWHLSKKG